MLSYARHLLVHFMFRQPARFLNGATWLCVAGIVVGAGTATLIGRRRDARVVAMEGVPLAVVFPLFCLADWVLLMALPHLRLSFSTEIRLCLVSSLFVRLLIFWGLMGAALLARVRARLYGAKVQTRGAAVLFLTANLLFSGVQVDAYILEPLLVETTEVSLSFGDLDPTMPPVRVIHLTDTHIERNSFREAMVVRRVNALQPDLILFTGDYLNLSRLSDPVSAEHFRQFVAQLEAAYGIYAVRGSVDAPEMMARLVEGTGVVWLEQEAVTIDVRGQPVTLVGVACSHQQDIDAARLAEAMKGVSEDAFTLLLYHSPDLIREATEHQADLYLAGHTHGGQLRLPFYGAIVTMSMYGKRYVSGLFEEGDTRMYVSRGLGFEGGGMPRARFLCRPEIVSIELGGSE
jgi:predicted MPP superfamily phosphohydrolase